MRVLLRQVCRKQRLTCIQANEIKSCFNAFHARSENNRLHLSQEEYKNTLFSLSFVIRSLTLYHSSVKLSVSAFLYTLLTLSASLFNLLSVINSLALYLYLLFFLNNKTRASVVTQTNFYHIIIIVVYIVVKVVAFVPDGTIVPSCIFFQLQTSDMPPCLLIYLLLLQSIRKDFRCKGVLWEGLLSAECCQWVVGAQCDVLVLWMNHA